MCQPLRISVPSLALKIQTVMTTTSVQQIHAWQTLATLSKSLSVVAMGSAPHLRPMVLLVTTALKTAVVMVYALHPRLPVVPTAAPKTAATVLVTALLSLTVAILPLAQLMYAVLIRV